MSIKVVVAHMQRGEYKLALSLIKKKILESPDNPDLLYNLIVCYNRIGQYRDAIDAIKSLIVKYPNYHSIKNIYKLLIYAYIQIEEYKIAIETTEERLSLFPRDVILLSFKAFSYEKMGEIDTAIDLHRTILDIDPEHKNSLNSISALLVSKKENPTQEDIDLAHKNMSKLIELEPENGVYLDTYGVTLVALGKKEEAKDYFKRAVELAPEKENVLSNYKKYYENA